MQFLSGTALRNAINEITFGANVRCAVAFWGTGSETLFPKRKDKKIRIICNLKMGGTNPFTLEEFLSPRFAVRQHDTLHAKVYINDKGAVVTSANASANGLGLEGREQATWNEAGLFSDDPDVVKTIGRWFEDTWNASRDIDGGDIENAKAAWRARQAAKPPLTSFTEFEVMTANLPLICWYENSDWEVNPKLIEGKTRRQANWLTERIEDGLDVDGPEDRTALTPGTWVLQFRRSMRGPPDARCRMSWTNVGPILEGAYRIRGERNYRSVALAAERPEPGPFPLNERRFRNLFQKVISDAQFKELLTDDYEGAWFTPMRRQLMRDFWGILHDLYSS
ncbi:MAG TPA: hypothetical protein VGG99_19010 [Acetobacteraceae bacterium]|jgi:hypothetical protein